MSTNLELAVAEMEKLIAPQGTAGQPKPNTIGFYEIRANALGLLFLKQCARDGIADEVAFNERYKLALRQLKADE